jgi:Tfp pilus assembly protein PilX
MMMRPIPSRRQRGSTLLVGLIMLVLMTLVAISSFNLGKSNQLIVANMQHRTETAEAAKATLEEVISKTNFSVNPSAALVGNCGTNAKCFDVNGDGTNDVTVTLNPVPCIKKSQIIKNSQLDLTNTEDLGCSTGATQNLGIAGAATGDSLCANTTWEISAVAADPVMQTSVTAVQGVAVRVSADSGTNTAYLCK